MANPIPVLDSDEEVQYIKKANSIQFGVNNNDDNKDFYARRARRDNVIGPWQPCEMLKMVENVDKSNEKLFIVRYYRDLHKKDVPEYELASRKIPKPVELPIGTRIIARRRSDILPYLIDESGQKILTLYSTDTQYYPAIVASFYDQRFMVFFDDGVVQLTKLKYIRRVLGNTRFDHAHWNAKSYFEWFLKQPHRLEVKDPEIGMDLKVELNGSNENAKVLKVEHSLAHIYFEKQNRYEWIYLGSPRITRVYRELIKQKKLDDLIDFKTFKTCLSAADDIVLIDPVDEPEETNVEIDEIGPATASRATKAPKTHKCSHECVQFEDKIKLGDYSILQRPFATGWHRNVNKKVIYRAPCGLSLQNIKSVHKYLTNTDSKLNVNSFEFNKNCEIAPIDTDTAKDTVKPKDISHGMENLPVTICGEMTSVSFNYTKDYKFDYIDEEPTNNLGRTGCDCTDCSDKSRCSCFQLTIERLMGKYPSKHELDKSGEIGYDYMKLKKIVKTGIVECGENCNCCAEKCLNRVVQNGLQHKLELFLTDSKGWGVRATTDIPEGVFVCIYSGDILHDNKVTDKRTTLYQFRLPSFPIDQEFDADSDSDSDGEPDSKRLRDGSDDVIQPFISYFPTFMRIGNAQHFPDSEDYKSHGYIIDALHNGNFSRFINHSCDANLFAQAAYIKDDKRFPSIAFFSSQLIKAGEELTIDYNYETVKKGAEGQTRCQCGTAKCRKWLF
ncbi:histone-lysine N-methyltransferase met-2-like [Contarinia nasturtii]|uniref:histone-lysine N-methyltransferase met-2-like n=1 Tax=Contarinia nasturtii TaxID=265458 RepID=UPI0012D4B700|nr:histone-lysine N-methyltransferase met-2-like [Contarinia nasturtii]